MEEGLFYFLYGMLIYMPMYIALFWAVLLLSVPHKNSKPKKFLGVFMLAATVVYFSHAVYFTQNRLLYLYIDSLYVAATLAVYPLYYWYIKLLTVEPKYRKSDLLLLIPSLSLATLTAIVYLIMDNPLDYVHKNHFATEKFSEISNVHWKAQRLIAISVKITFFVQVIWVLFKGINLIKKYNERINNFYSNTESRNINWVMWLIIIFSLTGIMSSAANLIGRNYFSINHQLLIIPSVVFGTLIFMIGYWGSSQNHTLVELNFEENENHNSNESGFSGYQKSFSNLADSKFWNELKAQLIILFEEKLVYRRSDIKITQVSEMLYTNRTYVSRLINEEFKCSFSFFVNRYRVQEAKEIIENDARQELSLEQIADVVGFTSAGSLIRNFKHFFGVTPGAFRILSNKIEKNDEK